MEKRLFIASHENARRNAANFILHSMPEGWAILCREPLKKRDQEEKYHAMLNDIAKSGKFEFLGRSDWDLEDIKRLLIEAFANEMENIGTPLKQKSSIVPSLDLKRTVQLGIQSRDFSVKEASNFIEYLYSYTVEIGIKF